MKRIYNAETKRRNVTITQDDWETLKKLGMGNASEGIRVLTQLYTSEGCIKR